MKKIILIFLLFFTLLWAGDIFSENDLNKYSFTANDNPSLINHLAYDSCYSICIQNEMAIFGNGKNIILLDLMTPTDSTEINRITLSSPITSVKTKDSLLFAIEQKGMLHIFNINNPQLPEQVSNYYVGPYSSGDTFIYGKNIPDMDISDSLICVVNGWGGLQIIDISDINNPISKSQFYTSGIAYGVDIQNNYVYVATNNMGIRIIDISNTETPVEIGYYKPSSDPPDYYPNGYALKVVVDDNYAYVADGLSGIRLRILDISNPSSPCDIFHGNYYTGGYGYNLALQNDFVYVLCNSKGLFIYDIVNKAAPNIVGTYDFSTPSSIAVDDSLICVVDVENGLYILSHSPSSSIMTTPYKFNLHQNYPNPFNPITTIHYDIYEESKVRIDIYDVHGQCVETLVDEYNLTGAYKIKWNASKYSSGIYIYRLQVGDRHISRKMLLIK